MTTAQSDTPAEPPSPDSGAATSIFARAGGFDFFERLVEQFYVGVRADPVLFALYPQPDDLASAKRHLTLFLAQYWGGPTTYDDERGHPRLRMRHAGFPIDDAMRDRWMTHMSNALAACAVPTDLATEMHDDFVRAADHLRNV